MYPNKREILLCHLMTCGKQCSDGLLKFILLDQQIISVEGGDGEDADASLREGSGQGGEDADQREVERAIDAQRPPATFGFYIGGDLRFFADDGEFVSGAGDRDKRARCPRGNWRVGGEAADGEGSGQQGEIDGNRHNV